MLKRHEIVVRIIETNSRRLRLDNEINGLDIERRIAERDVELRGAGEEQATALAGIRAKLVHLEEQRNKLAAEHDWLEQALAEFDGTTVPAEQSKPGQA